LKLCEKARWRFALRQTIITLWLCYLAGDIWSRAFSVQTSRGRCSPRMACAPNANFAVVLSAPPPWEEPANAYRASQHIQGPVYFNTGPFLFGKFFKVKKKHYRILVYGSICRLYQCSRALIQKIFHFYFSALCYNALEHCSRHYQCGAR
jgi:hypothetical protein